MGVIMCYVTGESDLSSKMGSQNFMHAELIISTTNSTL